MTLSVFLPFYNEEKLAVETIRRIFAVLNLCLLSGIASGVEDFEVLAIENGSTDKTLEVLKSLEPQYPQLRVIHLEQAGYGRALQAGFYQSRFDWIFLADSDLQFDYNELKLLLDKKDEGDLIIGYYLDRAVSLRRELNSFLWGLLMRTLFGLEVRDIDCGFKLINKKVIETISRLESIGAMISAELLTKAQRAGFKIVEVGVHHFSDPAGGTTGDSPWVILKGLQEAFALKRKIG